MSEKNKRMFSSIAENYDKVNRIISLGADIGWRKRTAQECLVGRKSAKVLDVATGTGDLAIAIAHEAKKMHKKVSVLGLDFNQDMLNIARSKVKRSKMKNVSLVQGDALDLELKAGSFDIITTGFALRNFDDLGAFIEEAYRVLKPGGKAAFLEVAKPDSVLGDMIKFYYFNVIPMIGSKYNKDAYVWLASSLWRFDKNLLMHLMKKAGFKNIKAKNLTFGVAFILTANKPKSAK